MKTWMRGLLAVALAVPVIAIAEPAAHASDNGLALTPQMGWSSWSFIRRAPTAAAIEAQADAMKSSGLAAVGYSYVNLDDFWYVCPGSQGPDVDGFGRWVTDMTKFPDGIKAVADHVHAEGLKFGIYVTPGISKQAVAQNTPIEGTPYHAADIATTTAEKNYNCKGMVGIDYTKPGAQEFINSWANQFASWGADYLKIDGVGTSDVPDIQAWSNALRQTGRPIHLELSNNLAISAAPTWKQLANGWRTSGDVECYCSGQPNGVGFPLTNWAHIQSRFNQVANWQPYGGPGGWNDYDSIEVGNGTNTGLTVDERKTQLSLWSLASSPLILGTDLTTLDPTDVKLLTNRSVIAVDQDGIDASRIVNTPTAQVFAKTEPDGDAVVGLFNLSDSTQVVSTTAAAVGLPAASVYLLGDLWSHLPSETGGVIAADVPAHGVALYRVHPTPLARLTPPRTTLAVDGLSTVDAGVPVTATQTFTDNGVAPVEHVRLGLSAPAGWTVTPMSGTDFASVAPGQSVQATFQVTAPRPASLFQSDTVHGRAEYRWILLIPQSVSVDQVVTTSATVQPPLQTYASTTASFAQDGTRLGIRAAGSDVYGATNQYGAIYLKGAMHDGTVAQVQVSAQANTNAWAKAGIMVRNDITASGTSPGFLILAEAPGHGYVIQWDSNGDGQLDSNSAPNNTGVGTAAYPSWLRLTRTGTSYTGWYSTDGSTWTLIATVTVPTAADAQDVGTFATSHSSGTVGEVDFDGFTVG